MSNLATIVNNILADSGIDDINVVVTTGSYTNPAWIVSLPWTKITGTPTTLAGYGITDAYTQTQVNNIVANYLPLAGGIMTGQIVLKEGTDSADYTKGLRFPNDPYGGGLDVSGLRLYRDGAGTEKVVLELYVGNDATGSTQDRINFRTGVGGTADNNLVTINDNIIWNAGNLPSPQTAITLTTTGTSGAATFIGATLNIPQYQSVLTNPVTGTGDTNYLPKFTGSTTIGNSAITDNGSIVTLIGRDLVGTVASFSTSTNNTTFPSLFLKEGSGSATYAQISGVDNFHGLILRGVPTNSTDYSVTGGNQMSFYEFGGDFRFYKKQTGLLQLQASIIDGAANFITNVQSPIVNINTTDFNKGAKLNILQGGSNINGITINSGLVTSAHYGTFANNTYLSQNYYFDGTQRNDNATYGQVGLVLSTTQVAGTSSFEFNLSDPGASNPTNKMRLMATGNLLVGPNADSGFRLDVSGTGRFSGSVTATGNAATNSAVIFNNPSGANGTAQFYGDFTAGATLIGRIFRGNGASGVVGNGLNIDNFGGFQIRVNQLGGSGDSINLLGGNVGIGASTNPQNLLEVSSAAGSPRIRVGTLQNNNNTPRFEVITSDGLTVANSAWLKVNDAGGFTLGQSDYTKSGGDSGNFANLSAEVEYPRITVSSTGAATFSSSVTATNGIFNGVSTVNLKIQNGSTANTTVLVQSFGTEAAGENASILFKSAANNTNTEYAKGLIAFRNNGTGYGRGDIYFATENGTGSSNALLSNAKMVILAGGNVGIGTTSPAYKLDLTSSNDGYARQWLAQQSFVGTGNGTAGFQVRTIDATSNGVRIMNAAANATWLTIASTGAATFSSSVTATRMTVSSDNSGVIVDVAARHGLMKYFLYSTGLVGSNTGTDASISTWLGRYSGTDITAPTGVFQDLVVFNSGNIGIATTTDAGFKLDVNGFVRFTPSAATSVPTLMLNQGGAYGNIAAAGDMYHGLIMRGIPAAAGDYSVTAGDQMSFYEYGGIFNFYKKQPGVLLRQAYIDNGNYYGVAYFETSDATIKTLVQDNYQAEGIESVVAKLYIKNGKKELGYYAQDLESVLPSAVSKDSDGLLNLSYREVHTAKIAYLEKRITELEQQLKNK
jgi:hypothetical protein